MTTPEPDPSAAGAQEHKRWPVRRTVLVGGLGVAAGAFFVGRRLTSSGHGRSFNGHHKNVVSVAFSPDGRTLATGSLDRTARLWDVATGRTRAVLTGHQDTVESVAFSPDGRTLATAGAGNDDTVRLWDVATGRATAMVRCSQGGLDSVAFSPDGRTLVTTGGDIDEGEVRLWKTPGSGQA